MARRVAAVAALLFLLAGCDSNTSVMGLDVVWISTVYQSRPLTGVFVKMPIHTPSFHAGRAGIAVVELLPYRAGTALGIVVADP